MEVTASQLRANIYRLLDGVVEGHELTIVRGEHRLRVVAETPPDRLAGLVPIDDLVVGDPDELVDLDLGDLWSGEPLVDAPRGEAT